MLELNEVELIGNLTRDPEKRSTHTGKTVTSFSLAVNRGTGDKKTTAFIDCKAWAERGEWAADYLKKGKRVYVRGSLQQESWESREGQKRSKLVVNCYRIDFALPAALEPNAAAESQSALVDTAESMGMAGNGEPFPDPQADADPTPAPAGQEDMFPDSTPDDDLPF